MSIENLFNLVPKEYKCLVIYRRDDGLFTFNASSNKRRSPLRFYGDAGKTMEEAIENGLKKLAEKNASHP